MRSKRSTKSDVNSRKTNANRENARLSSGPKTKIGKQYSSRNALRHGFFAQEMVLSEAEKEGVHDLRRDLRTQLVPTTPLENIAVDKIVCCCWRLKLAARLEMRRVNALLDRPNAQETQPEQPVGPAAMLRWYAAGRQDLRYAIRFLEDVRRDFEAKGEVREEWKENLDKTVGPGFYELLAKWTPMSLTAILMANHLVTHKDTFGNSRSSPDDKEPARVIRDPNQSLEMVGKLLDQQLQHLYDLRQSWDERTTVSATGETTGTVDFATRYFTTASRDLHRAVDWFLNLKKNRL